MPSVSIRICHAQNVIEDGNSCSAERQKKTNLSVLVCYPRQQKAKFRQK